MNEERLNNLIKLSDAMKKESICIYMYNFLYNDIRSTIIVDISKVEYIKLSFVTINNPIILQAKYSKNYLDLDLINLLKIYKIKFPKKEESDLKYKESKKAFFNNFYEAVNRQTPTSVNINDNNRYQIAYELAKRDSNEAHIYCYAIVANGRNGHRSHYNSSLAKIMKPDLFEKYKDDQNISFRFSENKNDEKTTQEIINNYKGKRKF